MRVAIMGAGLSGLSCAITLEKYGVKPEIFEKRNCTGDRFVNAEGLISVLNRPVKNSLDFLAGKYGIALKPIDSIDRLFVHSNHEVSLLRGPFGYTNIRGRHEDSFENQLARMVKSEIRYNCDKEYDNLCREFDAVILATGDGAYAAHNGNYNCHTTFTLKGATVEGRFETDTPHLFFNYEVVPKGYSWILPYNSREANLVISYPDYPDNIKLGIDDMWNGLYALAEEALHQKFRVTDRFEITRYLVGICNKPRIDNTYYIGNCFGTISPGFGFGQFTSVLTGVYAALDICGKGKYEEMVKPLFKNFYHSLVLRENLENYTDEKFDSVIRKMNGKTLNRLIQKVCGRGCGFDLLKWSTPLMRLLNSIAAAKKN